MKIGQVAEAAGLPIQTIRFYEDQGLLAPRPRTESGYRVFGDAELDRLDFIKKAKRLGLSLPEIKDVLAVTDRGEATCEHVRQLLSVKVAEIDQAVRELSEFRASLAQLLDNAGPVQDCRPSGGRICAFIEQAPLMMQPAVLQRMERGKAQEHR